MTKKKLRLIILDSAKEEILEFTQVYKLLAGTAATRKFLRRIHSALGRLREQPNMGMALEEREFAQQGYRKLICDDYLCFYRVIGDSVYVYHVADGRSQYKRLFHNLPKL